MTGFDDAFDAQVARSRENAQAASTSSKIGVARISGMRASAERQLTAAGRKGVAKLRSEQITPVVLIADLGRLRRNTPVGTGWPLGKTAFATDTGKTLYRFRWFLLDDGRWAPNGRFMISDRLSGPTGQIDQRRTFEDAYRWLIDEVDICEKTLQGYKFGGLVHVGTRDSTSKHLPLGIELAFDESTDQLIHASRSMVVSREVSSSVDRGLRMVPVEVALAELVAQAVLDPPPSDWR